MDEAFIPRMFEPFEQEHAASQAGQMGTGLGLSIARQLLDLMGGKISVASRKGKGTTFTVELFLEQAAESVDPVIESVVDLAVLDGHRVLLCEDNPLNQEITTAVLEMRGLSVLSASNGQQGINQFEASEPIQSMRYSWISACRCWMVWLRRRPSDASRAVMPIRCRSLPCRRMPSRKM
jgi:hypothetical protein